jgi:hypothetical protein
MTMCAHLKRKRFVADTPDHDNKIGSRAKETLKSIALITLDAPTISDDPMGQPLHISFFLVKTLEISHVQTAINTLHSKQSRTAHVQTVINARQWLIRGTYSPGCMGY